LFEVEVSGIEPFRNLIKALDAVVEEGCFDIDERARSMDLIFSAMSPILCFVSVSNIT